MERLIEDGGESAQRCTAELVASLIRGTKHWTFEMTESLWSWLAPLIRKALSKVSVETIGDWGTAFATASESRDPNRIYQGRKTPRQFNKYFWTVQGIF
jgi:proteasome activator subunit 4